MENTIFYPAIPYNGPIFGDKFNIGKIVRIKGIIPYLAYRFDVNLQSGPAIISEEIAIQVSICVLDGYILLNSFENGIWSEEIRQESSPIKRGTKFEIVLISGFNHFKVMINGQHYCDFPQKIHSDRITHLAIHGDVSVAKISYDTSKDIMSSSYLDVDINASAPLLSHMETESNENFLADLTPIRVPFSVITRTVSTDERLPPLSYDNCKHSVSVPPALNINPPNSNGVPDSINPSGHTKTAYPPGTSYGVDGIDTINISGYSPSVALNILPPLPDAAVPLNADCPPITMEYRNLPTSKLKNFMLIICGMILGFSICAAFIVFLVGVKKKN